MLRKVYSVEREKIAVVDNFRELRVLGIKIEVDRRIQLLVLIVEVVIAVKTELEKVFKRFNFPSPINF